MLFGNDIKKIEKYAGKGNFDKIIPFLKASKKDTRLAAIKSVSSAKSEAMFHALIGMLGCEDVEERLAIVENLGRSGNRTAIEPLEHALAKETSATVANAIKMGLSRLRTGSPV